MSSEQGEDKRQWFYASGDRQIGPHTRSEIESLVHSGGIKRQMLVWADGMEEWRSACDIPDLSALFPAVGSGPPALPTQGLHSQPQYATSSTQQTQQVAFQRQKSPSTAVILLVVGLVVLGGIVAVGIIAAIVVPNVRDLNTSDMISTAKNDLRSLDVGIQSYFVDYRSYPRDVVSTNGLPAIGSSITTPVAYTTSFFKDPFAGKETDNTLRFFSFMNAKTGKGAAVIWSLGPDQKNNVPWKELGRTFDADELMEYIYDPTNGTVSGGDILRVSEQPF